MNIRKIVTKPSKIYRKFCVRLKLKKRDSNNLRQFGSLAPAFCQRIFIDPRKVEFVISSQDFDRHDSGRVVPGDWDKKIVSLDDFPKYTMCHDRYVNHKSWEETGAYKMLLDIIKKAPGTDGCYTKQDVVERYNKLDLIYETIKREQKLRHRGEISPKIFRESGGIYVHIDRNGDIIFGGGGCHRFAIAKILELPEVPAQIGVVHSEALPLWQKYIKSAPH